MPSSDQSDCTSRPSESRSRDADRHRPRRVHPGAERREDAHAPVADLVAEALDNDGAVGGHGAGRVLLVAQEGDQVLRGLLVERMLLGQPLEGLLLGQRRQLARGLADRLAELVRPAGPLALPERDQARARPAPARRAPGRA